MSWGENSNDEARAWHDWDRRPVPAGSTRVVQVVIEGFHNLTAEPLLVARDDTRLAVRRPDGELRWWSDDTHQAHPRDGALVVVLRSESVLPRDNRAVDAAAVCSLTDLLEGIGGDDLAGPDADGGFALVGDDEDGGSGRAVRDDESGVVLRASGVHGRGPTPWRVESAWVRLVPGEELLAATDVPPPVW